VTSSSEKNHSRVTNNSSVSKIITDLLYTRRPVIVFTRSSHHLVFWGTGTVNQFYYREILERLRKRVVRVRPSIANNWMLHHDNAPCHTAISVIECLAIKGIPVVPQPPYSPDLSPCDLVLFPKLKFHLKGRHFRTVENIEKAVTDQLKTIPVSDFQRYYEEWQQRLRRCAAS